MDERTVIAQLLMLGPRFTSADILGIVSFDDLHDMIGDGFVEITKVRYNYALFEKYVTYQVTQLGKDQLK